jgi:dTDP-glucose pyrophosphorylase
VIRIFEIADYTCSPLTSVRNAMARLGNPNLRFAFQIVVDGDGKLLGTLTDGDIRRALLRGSGLDGPIAHAMQSQPKFGLLGDNGANLSSLRSIGSRTAFLPVLDGARTVREILVLSERGIAEFSALVMAGGFGRRLGEQTLRTPKPLLPVGGKPILEHILDRIEGIGASKVYVSVHHLGEQIESFVKVRRNSGAIGVLREVAPLGTAGALGLLPPEAPSPVLILNGDILTSLDLAAFLDFHASHGHDATIAVAQHQVNIPFGVVRHGDKGQFLGIDEKPTLTNYVAAGIYFLSAAYRALVRADETVDMPELLARGSRIGLNAGLFPIHEYWTDVGRPEDLERARLAVRG